MTTTTTSGGHQSRAEPAEFYMRPSDAFSWYIEDDPVLRSTVVSITWLDRPPDWHRLVERVDLVTRLIPTFRQRAVAPPGRLTPPRFSNDPGFDLTWHVRRLVAPASDPEYPVRFARIEAMTGFDRARPLWRASLIEGLPDERAALVVTLHHSLTDGVGGIQLAALLFDQARELPTTPGPPPAPLSFAPDLPSPRRLVQEYLVRQTAGSAQVLAKRLRSAPGRWWSFARRPAETLTNGWATAFSVGRTVRPVVHTLSPIMTGRGLGRHLDFFDVDLAALKAATSCAGGSINDGFLAAVSGGLRAYHVRHGAIVGDLRVTMPINLRTPHDPPGGNRITLMRYLLPAGEADPVERIRLIKGRSWAARHEPSLPHTNAIAAALNLLPPAAAGAMLKHVDVVASDVPGVAQSLYLAGAEVERYAAFGPTTGAALNVTLLSYRTSCCIGVTIDTAAVPDPDELMSCLRQGFDEVLAIPTGPRNVTRRGKRVRDHSGPRAGSGSGVRTATGGPVRAHGPHDPGATRRTPWWSG